MNRDYVDDVDPALELTEIGPPHLGGPADPHAEPLDPNQPLTAEPATDPIVEHTAPRRRRWFLRSLTSRLVVGVVALVTVLVIAIGTATYFALHSYLLNRLDQQLAATARKSVVDLLSNQNAAMGATTFGSPQTIWVTQLDSDGTVLDHLDTAHTVKHLDLRADDRQELSSPQSRPTTVVTTGGLHVRVVSEEQPRLQGVVVIGLATSDLTDTLHQLFLIELAIGGGAVLLAFVATSYGVRLSLRPLRRVTRTAQEVTAELSPEGAGLDRRVPMTDADTEVGQVAESVNTLLGAVETQFAARVQSEDRMRQFLADASHELRTPLTSIRGYAELARMRRATGDDTAADSDALARIESEGTRMSRLVEDLLLLARSDRGAAPQREPVEIGDLVADAVDGARAAFPHRRVDAVVPAAVIVNGDRDQLLRLLRNLITNAAVHTAPDGPIRVSGHGHGDQVVLEVADSGPGLAAEDSAHVFERFWRADKARTRARGGTGLGLAIVASIVQAHGGTVSFDSTVETGSTVTVRLPGGSLPA